MFFVSTVAAAAASSVVFPTRLRVRCLENPSSAVVRWWWSMGAGGGEGVRGWDKTKCKLLGASSTSWWTTPSPPSLFRMSMSTRGGKKEKGWVRRDADSITATAAQTGAPCLRVLIHLHSEVTRRRVSRRAVFLYLLNKILNAPSSSSRAPSPTMQFFHFNQRLRKPRPRPFPQRCLVRSACHYMVTLQMEQDIRVIKTKMQGHNS